MRSARAIVAVLAGGRGERLGGAKACVPLLGVPLIAYPLRAASDAGLEAVVVAKRGTALPALAEKVLLEPAHPRHPLQGVVTALEFASRCAPVPAVLITACDMPFVNAALLAWMAGLEGPAVASLEGRLQPALCRCETDDLPALREALAAGQSLSAAIAALAPRIVDEGALRRFGDPVQLCFNVNSPKELDSAQAWLSAGAAASASDRAQAPASPSATRAAASRS